MNRKQKTRRAGHFAEGQHDGQNDRHISAHQGDYDMNKVQTKYHAEEFLRRNPDFWIALVAWALNEAAHGRKFSISYFVEHYRWRDRVDSQGEPFKLNDHWIPIFARMLASQYPEVRGYIELRKSAWDDDYPEAFEEVD